MSENTMQAILFSMGIVLIAVGLFLVVKQKMLENKDDLQNRDGETEI